MKPNSIYIKVKKKCRISKTFQSRKKPDIYICIYLHYVPITYTCLIRHIKGPGKTHVSDCTSSTVQAKPKTGHRAKKINHNMNARMNFNSKFEMMKKCYNATIIMNKSIVVVYLLTLV